MHYTFIVYYIHAVNESCAMRYIFNSLADSIYISSLHSEDSSRPPSDIIEQDEEASTEVSIFSLMSECMFRKP